MKEQVKEITVCERDRSRDGTETESISSFPLKAKWKPPLIDLAEFTVCVSQCVFVRKYQYTSV